MLQGPKNTQKRARALRKEMSLPEMLLWQRLKGRPNGLKFRRQHPAGKYVLDFYCSDARLIVEVDGQAHGMGDRPERDEVRDSYFRRSGLRVLRLAAADVLRDPDESAASIVAYATGAI
ncbi:MAG TPA: endonuclease domain-containing protein [Novosphingobium sp.]